MTVLSELNTLLSDMSIQTETAKLSDKALDEYVVLVPISDNFSLFSTDIVPTKIGCPVSCIFLIVFTIAVYFPSSVE